MINLGLVPRLAGLLVSANEKLLTPVAGCLASLALSPAGRAAVIKVEGLVPSLAKLLGSANEQLLIRVAGCLLNLSLSPEGKAAIISSGGNAVLNTKLSEVLKWTLNDASDKLKRPVAQATTVPGVPAYSAEGLKGGKVNEGGGAAKQPLEAANDEANGAPAQLGLFGKRKKGPEQNGPEAKLQRTDEANGAPAQSGLLTEDAAARMLMAMSVKSLLF